MKTKIVFFEDSSTSLKGTFRGIIASAILFAANSPLYKMYGKAIKFVPLCIIIIIILIASAISVQNPASLSEALIYSGLIGLVVFGSLSTLLLMTKPEDGKKWTRSNALAAISVGVASSIAAGAVLYAIKPLQY